MKKKLLALFLAVTMLVSAIPFSVFAEDAAATEDLTYTTGLNDGAVYALKVPDGKTFGQAYQWTTDGYNLSIRHEEKESFILYDEKAFNSILWAKSRKEFNTSIYAAGTTYAPELAKKNEYAGGVPATADVSNTKYLAIRIKHIDNNPVGTYDVTRFKPYISCGGQYGMHSTSTDIPAYWYDLTDGSYNPWYGNNGFWKSTEGAFQFVGDADGYIILPYTLNSNVTAAKIASSFTNLQFYFYESDAVVSGDNQRKKASFKNKEFLIGDSFFIEDIEKFVTAQNADRGIVRYSSGKGDTAWIANKVNGATRNAVRGWAWAGGKAFCDPFTESNNGSYNYAHAATISDSEIGIYHVMNEGKTTGNFSVPINGTYETSRHATDKFQGADGIPAAIDLSKMTYLAQRVIFKGSEANPLNGQGFRLYLNNASQAHCNSSAEIILIDDGRVSTVKYNGGLDFYEDFDGWILVPKSGWTDAYWADAYTTWSGGFQYFFDGDCSGTTLAVGNMYFVEDAEAFKLVHSNPTITEEELLISENSIIVKEPNAKYTYSIDNQTWNSDGIFRGLNAETNYTVYVKNTLNGLVGNVIVKTANAYATGVGDSGYYYMAVPDEETYIRYGKGMGWSSNYFWRNYMTGEYQPDNQSGNAAVFVEKVGNETFVNLTMNPAYNEKAFPFCPNHSMVPNMLTLGNNNFTGAYDVENITHLAMRFKLTGLEEGKSAKLGVLADPFYFWDMSTAYLIDYETKEVTDPGWTGEQIIFTKNFDGWVVFPLDNMGSDTKKTVTYKDASGADASYELTFKQALFNQIAPINGEKNAISNYQFWFHNDDESNNDGAGNEGCSHWVQNSDWRGTTLYMGDMVVFSDKEAFETARLSCDYAGHSLVVDEKAATCTEDGYKKTTCSKCDYAETITYEAEGHDYIVDEKAASCTEAGYKKTTCSKCDYAETITYEAAGHSYSATIVPPTETEMGYTEHVCSNCGDNYKDNYTYPTKPGDDYLGLNIFHFTGYADNYTTDGVNTDADVLKEIEDVLAQGYMNQMFIGADDLMEEKIALCKKYNCKFWTGAGKFYSDRQTIENYIANVSVTVDRIIAADAWDLFLGFNWDEPIWGGMSNEDFYTMTKALYEKWGKRNYPVFATGAFIDGYGDTCDTIAPEYLTYVTDAGWDSYSYDVRDSALNNAKQNAQLAKNNEKYGTNITNAKDHYRWVQNELAEKFDHDVNFWFYPCAYRNYLWTGAYADEDYCMAHLEFFTELLMEQENKGGITLYTYATFSEGGTPGLDQYLPVPNITTGEQIMFPEVDKWEDYAQYVKELKVQFSQTPIYFAENLVFGSLYVTHTDSDSITIRPVEGYEYSIDGGATYQTTATFAGLTAETAYTIRVKRTEDGMYKDFVVMTRAEKPYATGYNDTASYALNVPDNLNVYGGAYGWVGAGLSRDFANTEFTAEGGGYLHVVTDESGDRFLEIQNDDADAMFTYNLAFGDNGRANSKKGISEGVDTSKLTAFAFRIKTEGGTADQLSIFDFYINQRRSSKVADAPLTLIDYNSGTVTTSTDANIIKYENGINVIGNVDGWLIVPFDSYPDFDDFSATPQISWLEENFNGVNVYLHEEKCVSHHASASSWDNKNLYLGDMLYVEDVDAFITVHDAPAALELSAVCVDRIKVNAVEGMEYSLDKLTWSTDGIFEGLASETEYTVYARKIGGSRIISATATTITAHNYGAQSIKPTCTEQGYTLYTCRVCGDSYKTNIRPAAGHKMEVTEHVDATCTDDGYTTSVCSVCGLTETTKIPAIGHTAEFDRQQPTCTEDGYILYDCPFCGIYEEVLPATGHTRGEAVEVEPSCTEQGYTGYICTTCGETVKETIADALGHDEIIEEKAPTCTDAGYKKVTCSKCDYYEETTYDATGHSNKTAVIAPTCTEQGYTKSICTVCGAVTISDYVEATGHSFVTEVTDGKNVVYCEKCDYVKGIVADNNSATVTFDAVEGAVKYFVKIQNGDWYKVVSTTETTLTINGLEAGVDYTVTVSAKLGTGKYTEYGNAMTVSTPADTVCTLQGTTVMGYTFLRFNCTGANKYWVKRVNQDGSVTQIKVTDANTLTLDYPAGEYTFYVITRVNVNGTNKYITSNEVTVTVA